MRFILLLLLVLLPKFSLAQDRNVEVNLDVLNRYTPRFSLPEHKASPRPTLNIKPSGRISPADARALRDKYFNDTDMITAPAPAQPISVPVAPNKIEQPAAHPKSTKVVITETETRIPIPPPPRLDIGPLSRKPATVRPPAVEAIPIIEKGVLRDSKITKALLNAGAARDDREMEPASSLKAFVKIPHEEHVPKTDEIKGLRITSIGYIDDKSILSADVLSALEAQFVPLIKAHKGSRIGLYSYARHSSKDKRQSQRLALVRALALRENLINMQAAAPDDIETFPVGDASSNGFANRIDIIIQK